MQDNSNSLEINKQLLEFEQWRETAETGDLESFINEKKFPEEVAAGLRQIALAEQVFEVAANYSLDDKRYPGSASGSDLTGVLIGKYRCLQRLGVGGMGEVWLAEQSEPAIRKVAIKLIRSEIYSDTFAKRFESEQQAMALMSHPNIAKVLDNGYFGDDRPFFVMEYVPGLPITDYCRENKLSLNQRLELFLQLCDAIQHAHQKGLLHRDIKPNNIIVCQSDGEPVIKVIDFGLAKPFSNSDLIDLKITETRAVLGSPLWMSPEQANGKSKDDIEGVDTRSDIYSVGVVLYQLLTNSTPISNQTLAEAKHIELLDAICNQVPPYPSIRLSEQDKNDSWVEKQTTSSVANWSNMLRNDLDWVTMKAIEKDRERRYPAVSALADDVRRFLRNEPVLARPPSVVYRIKKLISKHRVASLATIISVASLLVATVVSTCLAAWAFNQQEIANQERAKAERFAVDAQAQQENANRERVRAEQVVNFFVRSFEKNNVSNPGVVFDDAKLELLHSWREEIDQQAFSDPLDESGLRMALARALSGTGEHRDAIVEYEKAISIYQKILEPKDDLVVAAEVDLAEELVAVGECKRAAELAKKCYIAAKETHGNQHQMKFAAELVVLQARSGQGRFSGSVKLLEKFVRETVDLFGEQNELAIQGKASLAAGYYELHNYDKAHGIATEARKLAAAKWGEQNRKTIELDFLGWLASVRNTKNKGSYPDLEKRYLEVVEKYGDGNPIAIEFQEKFASVAYLNRQWPESLKLYEKNLAACRACFGENHIQTARALRGMAKTKFMLAGPVSRSPERFDESLATMRSAIEIYKKEIGAGSHETLQCLIDLGQLTFYSGKYQDALELADGLIVQFSELQGPDSKGGRDLTDLKARCHYELKDVEKGIELFCQNYEVSKRVFGEDSKQVAQDSQRIAYVYYLTGDLESALTWYEKCIALFEKRDGLTAYESHRIAGNVIDTALRLKKYDSAESWAQKMLTNLDENQIAYEVLFAQESNGLAEALVGQERFDEAREVLTAVLATKGSDQKRDDFDLAPLNLQLARAKSILAMCCVNDDEFAEAESLLIAADEGMQKIPTHEGDDWYKTRCLERLIDLYSKWGKTEKEAAVQARLDSANSADSAEEEN